MMEKNITQQQWKLQKKTPAEGKQCRSKVRLYEQFWLQLICCTLVSGHEVVMYFGVKGSRQIRGPKEVNQESGVDRKGVRTR